MKHRFHWDNWNLGHIQKHQVSRAEAEFVIKHAQPPFPREIDAEKSMVRGPTFKGRLIQAIYVLHGRVTQSAACASVLSAAVLRGVEGSTPNVGEPWIAQPTLRSKDLKRTTPQHWWSFAHVLTRSFDYGGYAFAQDWSRDAADCVTHPCCMAIKILTTKA